MHYLSQPREQEFPINSAITSIDGQKKKRQKVIIILKKKFAVEAHCGLLLEKLHDLNHMLGFTSGNLSG